jgi:hypothetical protein
MQIGEIMSRDVAIVAPSDSVRKVAQKMVEKTPGKMHRACVFGAVSRAGRRELTHSLPGNYRCANSTSPLRELK